MTLTLDNIKALINYRLERADETISLARHIIDSQLGLQAAVNRIYYACFYATNALITSKNLPLNSHRAVPSILAQYFVKTGELDNKWFKLYSNLLKARMTGDYDDFVEFELEEVEDFYVKTTEFITLIKEMLSSYILDDTQKKGL